MGWGLRKMVMAIEVSSTHFVGAAGSRRTVHGTAGLVGSARIGGNGIVGGAMSVQTD